MHCYFVLAGDSEIPVMYYVEHVREGRSFATRTVQARQRGKAIFTTTISFMRENNGGKKTLKHATTPPKGIRAPADNSPAIEDEGYGPFVSSKIEIINKDSEHPHEKRTRRWIKARERLSDEGGHQAHLSALAYISDSQFINTVSRIHPLYRRDDPMVLEENSRIKYPPGVENPQLLPEIGMLVSLDHSIYFHEPKNFRVDEWLFIETVSPWSGDGRGVVQQHMFSVDGTLVATCFQEVNDFHHARDDFLTSIAGCCKTERA